MEETTQLEIIAPSALMEITKAEIDTQIATAKAFPRSIETFRKKAMSMATLSEDIAASCNYAVPRAGKAIEGKSVRLAEIVLSAYGNVRAGARIMSNDGKMITAQGICHDLETNSCITKEVQRKITDKNGKIFSQDMQIVTGNAASSIALRNAIFACIPSALTDEVYEKSKEVAKGKAETLVKRRDKAIAWFKEKKITDARLCEILEIKKVEDIDLDKLQTLLGFVNSVKNGETTLEEIFAKQGVDTDAQRTEIMELWEKNADKLSDIEKQDIQLIVDSNEVKSFEKTIKFLKSK